MKKIALVLPEAGPVPAVKGGAIEELLTILVEQNEIEHRVQFMVFCADNEQARAIAEKYKYSKIIYLPKTTLADRLINRVIRYSNRIIKNKTWIDIAYYRRVFRYLKEYTADLMAKGIRMIDEKPRYGAGGSSIAFVHPKATGGVLLELCQRMK